MSEDRGDVRAIEASIPRFLPKERKEKTFVCRAASEGCKKRTSDNKPWCVDHVERMPYAATLIAKLVTMTVADLNYPPDPWPPEQDGPRRRRRTVVPVRFRVGKARFWVALVPARGLEEEPDFLEQGFGPRRLDASFHAEATPFTLLLSRDQSRFVLLALQHGEAERIPREWLIDDESAVERLLKRFSAAKKAELEREEAEQCLEVTTTTTTSDSGAVPEEERSDEPDGSSGSHSPSP